MQEGFDLLLRAVVRIDETDVELGNDQRNQSKDFTLLQNFPNPFNNSTRIRFLLQEAGEVRLTIFNLQGKEIRRLINNFQPAGAHEISWDGRDQAGEFVPSGIYYCQLRAGSEVRSRKMSLIR